MPRPEYFTQVTLESGTSHMVCLVMTDPRIKVGTEITLKDSEDPTQLWEVISLGQPLQRQYIHSDWHNNI